MDCYGLLTSSLEWTALGSASAMALTFCRSPSLAATRMGRVAFLGALCDEAGASMMSAGSTPRTPRAMARATAALKVRPELRLAEASHFRNRGHHRTRHRQEEG